MGRLLGIDHGDSRIGLALSDRLHLIASPYKTVPASPRTMLIDLLREIIVDQEIDEIVVGLPLGMQNRQTDRTIVVRKFAEDLAALNLPIHLEDERLSSVSAVKSLVLQGVKTGHSKGLVDQTAAAIILQQYLDRKQLHGAS